jgi:diguanylate cyclase (GGDEF)-like protein
MVPSVAGQAHSQAATAARSRLQGKSIVVVWLTTFAFIAFLVGSSSFFKARMKDQIREHAKAVAKIAANRMDFALDVADRQLLNIVENLRDADLSRDAPTFTHARSGPASTSEPAIASLALVDPDGLVIASSITGDSGSGIVSAFGDPARLRGLDSGSSSRPIVTLTADGAAAIVARRIERNGALRAYAVARVDLPQDALAPSAETGASTKDDVFLRQSTGGADSSTGRRSAHSPAATASTLLYERRGLRWYPLSIVYGKNIDDMKAIWNIEDALIATAIVIALIVTALVTAGIRRRMLLTTQLETVRGHLIESNHALRAALAASEILAGKDQLTGLWNRRAFDQRLHEAIAHHGRHDGIFSLLLIDLDHFKAVNDRHGHVAGDEVLKRFADVLHERLRQNDVDARWGGEEFAVLADGANLDNAFLVAEHIRRAVESTVFTGPGRLTVSIGVAEYQATETADDLLSRVDDALYEAKRAGRNRVVASSGVTRGEKFFTAIAEPAPLFAEDFAQ